MIQCLSLSIYLPYTPLDCAYHYNDSPIRQEIIALLRLKGGKANHHDENGRVVGEGNG